ncbi:MAG: 1-deoxy-D-xylulose-5-phosphate synthase, partial [Lachnospiraceae bacterium]|nr:1-deoxy-D-xylulose-5-phosphate synthase [Lachnospiraceae bacterium]
EELSAEYGYSFTVVNARFVSPIDYDAIDEIAHECEIIFTCEENVERGGYGEAVAMHLLKSGYRGHFSDLALPDQYIVQGTPNELRDSLEFDPVSLKNRIKKTVDEHKNYDII